MSDIIKCKDCKYLQMWRSCPEVIEKYGQEYSCELEVLLCPSPDDYCSKAKRKEEPKTGQCKNCKWWKDSDGVYRRGVGAESQCPINRKEVYDGNGYCFMFKPQEDKE